MTEEPVDIYLASVRALRACILHDERAELISPAYRLLLVELRRDIDRIIGDLCGRCDKPLEAGEVGWHARCP